MLLQDDMKVPVEGQIVSSQTITSKSRTVETTTYAIEQEGGTETHIEQKVSLFSK
jgi:erythrocyte membrane protein band 4.1